MQNGDIINLRFDIFMCNTEYKLYELDKTGYQGHQFGVMNALHERPLAIMISHPFGLFVLSLPQMRNGTTGVMMTARKKGSLRCFFSGATVVMIRE